MKEIINYKFKVLKVEEGNFDYDTVFIEVNKNNIQIPILKTAIKGKEIVGKTIKIPCEFIKENEYLFNNVISEIEL